MNALPNSTLKWRCNYNKHNAINGMHVLRDILAVHFQYSFIKLNHSYFAKYMYHLWGVKQIDDLVKCIAFVFILAPMCLLCSQTHLRFWHLLQNADRLSLLHQHNDKKDKKNPHYLLFVGGINLWAVDSPHTFSVMWKTFTCYNVFMLLEMFCGPSVIMK